CGRAGARRRSRHVLRATARSARAARRGAPAARGDDRWDGGARARGGSGRRSDDLVELVERRDSGACASEEVAQERRVRAGAALARGKTGDREHLLDLLERALERGAV